MLYHLSPTGRALTWKQWKGHGGCDLSDWSAGLVCGQLGLRRRGDIETLPLGLIEDAAHSAGRELARFAAEHLNRPEWAVPYKEDESPCATSSD